MRKTFWKEGDYNAICDSCGLKFKASELKETWDNRWVCAQDWEARHPLDFPRTMRPPAKLPFIRSEPADTYIDHVFCTVDGMNGTAGHGTANCAIVGRNTQQGQ